MARRTLTDQEWIQLQAYVRARTGRWVEAYVEVLDHLASSIEDQWRLDPALPFEVALQTARASLGEQGVKGMIGQHQSEVFFQTVSEAWRSFCSSLLGPALGFALLIGWCVGEFLRMGVTFVEFRKYLYVSALALLLVFALLIFCREWRNGRRYPQVESGLMLAMFFVNTTHFSYDHIPRWLSLKSWTDWLVTPFYTFFILALAVLVVQMNIRALRLLQEKESFFSRIK